MIAYNKEELQKWTTLNEAEKWFKAEIIDADQWNKIQTEYASKLYHPPFWLRIILFLATIMGIYATVGFFAILIFEGLNDTENVIRILSIILGIITLILLEYAAIKEKLHYKSGVTEALLYVGLSNFVFGIIGFYASEYVYAFFMLLTGLVAAIRYVNLIGIVVTVGAVAFFVFHLFYDLGGFFPSFIPFAFILIFGAIYFISQKFQNSNSSPFYKDSFVVLDSMLLLLVYVGGNYFVVRELSIEMMGLELADGEGIPLSWLFHLTTVLIPIAYLYFGIKRKSLLLLRVGLLVVFAGVITLKIYYSTGHPEISLTIAGSMILGLTIWVLNYLKTPQKGYTREKLLSDKWDNINAESVLISSTMGGNVAPEKADTGFGGGEFGGGGAGGDY